MTVVKIRPAFASAWQAGLFLAVMTGIFTLPFVFALLGFSREKIFAQAGGQEAPYGFFKQEIFEQRGDIDMLFVGPCVVWWQVQTEIIQAELEKNLGRKAVVLNFGFNHYGPDLEYLLLRDVLRHRRVRSIVISTPRPDEVSRFPHPNAFVWWLYPSDRGDLRGLSFMDHAQLYAASVMGAFANLPLLMSAAAPAASVAPPEAVVERGGTKARSENPTTGTESLNQLRPSVVASDFIFERADDSRLRIIGPPPLDSYQALLGSMQFLAARAGSQFILLSSPLKSDFARPYLAERADWWRNGPLHLIGVPPAEFLARLTPVQRSVLFEGENLSLAGSRLFSRLIAPALAQVFFERTPPPQAARGSL